MDGELTRHEETELEEVTAELEDLKEVRKFWQGEVSKENEQEVNSKSFREADSEWIASVTGINRKYCSWTSFMSEIDETGFPSSSFQEKFRNI